MHSLKTRHTQTRPCTDQCPHTHAHTLLLGYHLIINLYTFIQEDYIQH